jgi:hypothetical protein
MGRLPLSLAIGLWVVGATWAVALVGYFLDFSSDIIWLVLLFGTGMALVEWRARQR